MKCFIYAQSCHLLVVNSYCLRTHTTCYMMWHSINYTYQSKHSMKISLSAPLLSALGRNLSLKLLTVSLLIRHILWAGLVVKNKNSKRRTYTFHGPIYAWNVNIFQVFTSQNFFYQILENCKGFQHSSLAWAQVPFLIPSLPTSSLCLWAQQGGQQLVGLPDHKWKRRKFWLRNEEIKICSPRASLSASVRTSVSTIMQ